MTSKSRCGFPVTSWSSVRIAFFSPVVLNLEEKIFTRASAGIIRIAPRTQLT